MEAPQDQVRRGGRRNAEFLPMEARDGGKTDVYQKAGAGFNKGITYWERAVMSIGMRLWRYVAGFPIPKEAGQVPLPEFP